MIVEQDNSIYESPDGGITVYKRIPGTDIREEVKIEWSNLEPFNSWIRFTNWDALAEMYPAIKEKLEELKVVEALCRKSE